MNGKKVKALRNKAYRLAAVELCTMVEGGDINTFTKAFIKRLERNSRSNDSYVISDSGVVSLPSFHPKKKLRVLKRLYKLGVIGVHM